MAFDPDYSTAAAVIDPLTAIRREVKPGETVVWSSLAGEAGLRRRVKAVTNFGRVFGGFALFWITGVILMMTLGSSEPPSKRRSDNGGTLPKVMEYAFPAFGTPFLLIGVYLLRSGAREAKWAPRTAYMLTDRRAVIVEAGPKGELDVTTLGPEKLGRIDKFIAADGSGDLVFQSAPPMKRGSTATVSGGQPLNMAGFYGIPEVTRVQQQIDAIVAASRGKAAV